MYLFKNIKHSLMSGSRSAKLSLFVNEVCTGENNTILDVGAADIEYSPFDNFLEKHYPYRQKITALSILPLVHFSQRYPDVSTVVFQGGAFPFEDNSFDVVHSNAVIEHVGGKEMQIAFVKELKRVGKKFFFTTPSRRFPIETHTNVLFLHYFPKRLFDRILRLLGKEWACGDYMNLLTRNELDDIMRQAGVKNFKIITKRILGLPLHYFVIGEKD